MPLSAQSRYFILNADDFGLSRERNEAVLKGYGAGLLKSASLCANGAEFESAVREVLPACPGLGVGVHLNIMEGPALVKPPEGSPLTGKDGFFKGEFFRIWLHSGNKKFLRVVEREFRAQIELALKYTRIDHIDSHVHVHGIPGLFRITAKLAKEYKIPWVRTQYEKLYAVPFRVKRPSPKRLVNLFKLLLLNVFSAKNKRYLKHLGLKTNDFLIGVGYTGMMDSAAIEYGLAAVRDGNVVEALIHPQTGKDEREYRIAGDKELKNSIRARGYEISNYGGCFASP